MIFLAKVNGVAIPHGLERLYMDSFPPEERREWAEVVDLACNSPLFDFYVINSDDRVVGFLTAWRLGDFRYIEHFATFPELRGRGIGLEAVKAFIAMDSTPVVLEVEPATSGEMARRRIEFYGRAGFTAHHDFPYVQPPYAPGLPSVALTLLTTAPVDLSSVTRTIHREVYVC